MTDCKEVIKSLLSQDEDVLREAAFSAGELNCTDAVTSLVVLLESDHSGVREAADASLRTIGGKEAVRGVIPLLRSEDATIRNLAMDILREIGDHCIDTLIRSIKDADPDIRIFIADILGSSTDGKVVSPLCEALLEDPEVNVRYQAAVSLGSVAHAEAIPCLNRAMGDEEWVQFSVIEALLKIHDESSVDAMIQSLDKASELVASMVVDALGEMGNAKAVPLLLDKIEHANPALQSKMMKSIVLLLQEDGLKNLPAQKQKVVRDVCRVSLEDDEEDVQNAAIQGIRLLGNKDDTGSLLTIAGNLDPVADEETIDELVTSIVSIGMNQAILDSIQHGSWKEAMVAVQCCKNLRDGSAAETIIQNFDDKDRDLQRAMSRTLLELSGDAVTAFFKEILHSHEDGHILRNGLEYLGSRIKDSGSDKHILTFFEHPYDDVKDTALEAAIALRTETIVSHMKAMVSSEEPLKRLMGMYGLGTIDPEKYQDVLLQGLSDNEPDVRRIALESITQGGLISALGDQLTVYLQDENRDVRIAIIEALGSVHDTAHFDTIAQGLDDPDDMVRVRTIDVLAQMDHADTVHRIQNLLGAENKMVAIKVIEALVTIGNAEAQKVLDRVLKGDDPELKQAAEDALANVREAGE